MTAIILTVVPLVAILAILAIRFRVQVGRGPAVKIRSGDVVVLGGIMFVAVVAQLAVLIANGGTSNLLLFALGAAFIAWYIRLAFRGTR